MSQPSREPSAEGTPPPEPPSETEPPPPPKVERPRAPGWAWGLLGFLFLGQTLVALDFWLFRALVQPLGQELALWDEQAGWLEILPALSASIWAPMLGYFADRMSRPRLLALGIAASGLATVATGLSGAIDPMQRARVAAGMGGATFQVVALTLVMDLFPRGVRARALALFFLAVPVGALLGMTVGPAVAGVLGWQAAFWIAGAAGPFLGLACLWIPEPVRGLAEGVPIPRLRLHEARGADAADYVDLMVNSSYTYAVFGLTFTTFAIGGLFYWLPSYLIGVRQLPPARTTALLAVLLPGAVAAGILTGGWLADLWAKANPRALFLAPALMALAAVPAASALVFGDGGTWGPIVLFATTALLFANLGPCHAILADVAAPNLRGAACGGLLAATHLLGDLWSPRVMGLVADLFGDVNTMATPFGRALAAVGATPVVVNGRSPENLSAALLLILPASAAAFGALWAGSRHLPRESALMLAKLRAAPAGAPAPKPAAPPGS